LSSQTTHTRLSPPAWQPQKVRPRPGRKRRQLSQGYLVLDSVRPIPSGHLLVSVRLIGGSDYCTHLQPTAQPRDETHQKCSRGASRASRKDARELAAPWRAWEASCRCRPGRRSRPGMRGRTGVRRRWTRA